IRIALDIQALEFRRARTDQGESAFRIGINQFFGRGRSLHQDAEPSKGIGVGKDLLFRLWNGRPGNAMKAIAPRDEVALQLDLLILVYKAYAWLRRRDIVQLDIVDVEENVHTLVEACGNQVLQDFMLGVERDAT